MPNQSHQLTRRDFLAAAMSAPVIIRAFERRGYTAALTTDFAVPHNDPDDYYDVACAVALGFEQVVLDTPSDAAVQALIEIGAPVAEPKHLRDADAVVIVGSGTNAARHWRRGQRIVLFAGDASGIPEPNELADPDAFRFLRDRADVWVPCFDGGGFRGSNRSSWLLTHDDLLLPVGYVRDWWIRYCGDVFGARSLYCGPLIRFAWLDRWRGHQGAGGFVAGPDYAHDMVYGTRLLLSTL